MALKEQLMEVGTNLPAPFQPQKDGTLALEYVVAERKWLLSRKKVTYRCRVRVDDAAQAVRMFEMLKETGFGLSSGSDDFGPGFGPHRDLPESCDDVVWKSRHWTSMPNRSRASRLKSS